MKIMRWWIAAILCLSTSVPALAQTLTIDPAWSEVGFSVSNLGVNTVYGRFDQFAGRIELNPQTPEQSTVHVVIQIASIDTQNARRDKHLRTPDFFDAAQYPEMTFESQSIEKKQEGHVLTGLLTIRGKAHPVSIPFTFTTAAVNGKTILHAQGKAQINRHDFGIDYGSNFSVGKTISIQLSVAATE
jgi:polyisoprenoid-binding protein YceI